MFGPLLCLAQIHRDGPGLRFDNVSWEGPHRRSIDCPYAIHTRAAYGGVGMDERPPPISPSVTGQYW